MKSNEKMRIDAIREDKEFQEVIKSCKGWIKQTPDGEIWLTDDIVALANACAALDMEDPDFIPVVRQLEVSLGLNMEIGESAPDYSEALFDLVSAAWLIVYRFFPPRHHPGAHTKEEYGFPSAGLWAWVLECLLCDEIPETPKSMYPVSYSFDPDSILMRAKLMLYEQVMRDAGYDPERLLMEKGYNGRLDLIAEVLAGEQRMFIEVLPGKTFSTGIREKKAEVNNLLRLVFNDWDRHVIPKDFDDYLQTIFLPRQHDHLKEEAIAQRRGGYEDISYISRRYTMMAEKTGYEPIEQLRKGMDGK